jgi:DNA-binding GntR family transcriptional regulator
MQETSTLKERAYTRIKGMLIDGALAPGQRLSNRKLASELGVSMIPVREAITQLASEGLVDYRAGEGCFVSRQSREDLIDVYDLREALECHAVTRAAALAGPEHIQALKDANDAMSNAASQLEKEQKRFVAAPNAPETPWPAELVAAWLDADTRFHWTIFQAAGNKRSLETVQKLRLLTQIFSTRFKRRKIQDLKLTLQEHAQIIDALTGHDAATAAAMMSKHIQRGRDHALKRFDTARLNP